MNFNFYMAALRVRQLHIPFWLPAVVGFCGGVVALLNDCSLWVVLGTYSAIAAALMVAKLVSERDAI